MSLYGLYNETQKVSALIDSGQHVEVLEIADSLMEAYQSLIDHEKYFAYLNLYKGVSYLSLGDFLLARYCDSLALIQARNSGNVGLEFTIRNNLAVIDLERREFDSCLEQCEQLVLEYKSILEEDQLGMLMNNAAWCAVKLKHYSLADSLYGNLMSIIDRKDPLIYLDPIIVMRNFGQYQMEQGNYKEASQTFDKAYRASLGKYSEDNYQTALSALYLGQCLWKLNQIDPAIHYLNQSVKILDPEPGTCLFSQYELVRIKAYHVRADFFQDQGNMEQSQRDITRAIELIRFVMDVYSSSESAHIFSGIVRPVFDLAIENELALAKKSHKKRHIDQAILLTDLAKRMSLQSQLKRIRRPESDLAYLVAFTEYHRLRLSLSSHQVALDSLGFLFDELKKKKAHLDEFQYAGIPGDSRRRIPRSYLGFYKIDTIYWVFKRHGMRRDVSAIPEQDISTQVNILKSALAVDRKGQYGRHDVDEFSESAEALFDKLMVPESGLWKPDLYVQPDGILNGLPISLLVDHRKGSKSGSIQTFGELLKPGLSRSVIILGSLQVIDKPKIRRRCSIGFFGLPDEAEAKGFHQEYHDLLPLNGISVKQEDQHAEILHFTGHSRVDQSNLHLSELSKMHQWDDILLMDNAGKRIFLNSCQTGLGQYLPGEGVMSLGHAFLLSGAVEVLESYWQIPDETSRVIAIEFYQNKGFRHPIKSLRRAQKKYLQQAPVGLDHPHYWSGVNLVSYQNRRLSVTYYVSGIVIAMTLIFSFMRVRRRY